MNLFQLVFMVLFAGFTVLYVVEKFLGRSIFSIVSRQLPLIQAIEILTRAVNGVYPSAYVETASTVLQAAIEATHRAEELWKAGSLPKEDRNAFAKAQIQCALRDAGIDVTLQIMTVIDGCIALVCMLMPHEADVV